MSGVSLFKGLVDATEIIVAKFGKDVLKEERFVNILADMYPDRDNPAVFKIIKTMLNEGLLKDLLSCTKNNIQNFASKTSLSLNQKNGFDKSLVEDIFLSIAVGSGVLSFADFNSIFNNNQTTPNQTINPNKPLSYPRNQKQTTTNSSPQQNKPPKKTTNSQGYRNLWQSDKLFLKLAWGVIGLLASPITYLALTRNADWWPLPTIIVVAIIHIFTIMMTFASFSDVEIKSANKWKGYPLLGGMYSALVVSSVLFWFFCPIIFSTDILSIQTTYYGFGHSTEWPSALSYIVSLILALISSAFLSGIDSFSGIQAASGTNIWNRIKSIFTSKNPNNLPFTKGFVKMMMFFILIGGIVCVIPIINNYTVKSKIKQTNETIEEINLQKVKIEHEREKKYQIMSFSDFKLGCTIDSCMQIIDISDYYKILDYLSLPYEVKQKKFIIKGENYEEIIDSVLYLSTEWDNKTIIVRLNFLSKILIGLSFTLTNERDSLLDLYTKKYGEPEYILNKIEIGSLDYLPTHFDDYEYLVPHIYYWTFKNGLIELETSSIYDIYQNEITITYFDRRCESILANKKAQEMREQAIEKKRIEDSIRREIIERKKQQEEEKLLQERNHRESIKKI